jgi:hypothetical protein
VKINSNLTVQADGSSVWFITYGKDGLSLYPNELRKLKKFLDNHLERKTLKGFAAAMKRKRK